MAGLGNVSVYKNRPIHNAIQRAGFLLNRK
jgi:hypothetical protein